MRWWEVEPGSESIPPLGSSVAQFTANFRSGEVRKYISSTLEAGVGKVRFVDHSLYIFQVFYSWRFWPKLNWVQGRHWSVNILSTISDFQIYYQGKSDKLFEYDHIGHSQWGRGMLWEAVAAVLTWIKEKRSDPSTEYNGGNYCPAH